MAPIRMMTSEITQARTGRSMKKRTSIWGIVLAWPAARRGIVGGRL